MTEGALDEGLARIVAAVADRIAPADESGPGALAAGADAYVARALTGEQAELLPAFAAGAASLDELASARFGRGFAVLPPDGQDAVLAEVEQAHPAFFELARRLVVEGLFGDPAWGGNRDGIGWALLRYPGPRLEWTAEEQQLGTVEES